MACSSCGIRNSLLSEAISNIAGNAIFGYLSTAAFTTLNPLAGTLFGAFAGMTFRMIDHASAYCCSQNISITRTIRVALSFFASIAVAAFATTLCGYSLTLLSGALLTLGMVATTIAINKLFNCLFRIRAGTPPPSP